IPVDIYRFGQISGDTRNGVWNITEEIPLIICAGGGLMGKIPNSGEPVEWIPVDIGSSCVVDIALNWPPNQCGIHHLLNPNKIGWNLLLNYLQASAKVKFEIVPMKEFTKSIDKSNPLAKLKPMFEKLYEIEDDSTTMETHFETTKTIEKTDKLKYCPAINQDLINLYLNYWIECGFLKS
ncbi:unnamed protein product, partial [Didymodactylos carnosus]